MLLRSFLAALTQALLIRNTVFSTYSNYSGWFSVCSRLITLLSDAKYAIAVPFSNFDDRRKRFIIGSDRNSLYESSNMLCILNLACFRKYFHFNRGSPKNLSLAARTKFCISLQTSFLPILSTFLNKGAYFSLLTLSISDNAHHFLAGNECWPQLPATSNRSDRCKSMLQTRDVLSSRYGPEMRQNEREAMEYKLPQTIQLITFTPRIHNCTQHLHYSKKQQGHLFLSCIHL